MAEKFVCEQCGGTFEKTRSDEEAFAEMQRLLPGFTIEQCAIVCEDCYQEIKPSLPTLTHEELMQDILQGVELPVEMFASLDTYFARASEALFHSELQRFEKTALFGARYGTTLNVAMDDTLLNTDVIEGTCTVIGPVETTDDRTVRAKKVIINGRYWHDRKTGKLKCRHGVILYGSKCIKCEKGS